MRGVKAYLKDHEKELSKHVAAIESDIGVFEPAFIGVDVEDAGRLKLAGEQLARIVRALGIPSKTGASSSDVGSFKALGVPALGLDVEGSTYFDYHHTPADTVDKVKPDLSITQADPLDFLEATHHRRVASPQAQGQLVDVHRVHPISLDTKNLCGGVHRGEGHEKFRGKHLRRELVRGQR